MKTHLDLFSGIGGFALAARWNGLETIGFSEIDPFACKVLKKHWPDVINYGDIRNIKGVKCELVTGGFPCQPFSTAGKRRGKDDHRHLWPEMLRVIEESKPRWVLGENVAGIINMELDNVLSDLGGIGYTALPFVVPACALGAGHRRNRVWIVANSERSGREGRKQDNGIPGCTGTPYSKPSDGIVKSWGELLGCRGSIREGDGIPLKLVRDEVKAFGNAIVPQVAAEIIRCMIQTEKEFRQ